MKLFLFGVSGLSLCGMTEPASAQQANSLTAGRFVGSYVCRQGVTPVIFDVSPDSSGKFSFGGAGSPSGVFSVRITARGSETLITPVAWIKQPANYSMVRAVLRQSGENLEGQILAPGCSSIRLMRENGGQTDQSAVQQVSGATKPFASVAPPVSTSADRSAQPATAPLDRSNSSAAKSNMPQNRQQSDAELARLPRPTLERPIFAETGGIRDLIYSLKDCTGRIVDAQLGLRTPNGYESFNAGRGDLCGDKPHVFRTIRVEYDRLARELLAGRLEDGYGKRIEAPIAVLQVKFGSPADIARYVEIAGSGDNFSGIPTADQISKAYSESFIRNHVGYQQLQRKNILGQPIAYLGGYTVVIDAEGGRNLLAGAPEGMGKLWQEKHAFYVDDDIPPKCKPLSSAFICTIRLSTKLTVDSFRSNILKILLSGKSETSYDMEQRARREAARTDFAWVSRSVTLTKFGDTWRSREIDAEMKRYVSSIERARAAVGGSGSNRPSAGDKCRAAANHFYDSGDLNSAAAAGIACPL